MLCSPCDNPVPRRSNRGRSDPRHRGHPRPAAATTRGLTDVDRPAGPRVDRPKNPEDVAGDQPFDGGDTGRHGLPAQRRGQVKDKPADVLFVGAVALLAAFGVITPAGAFSGSANSRMPIVGRGHPGAARDGRVGIDRRTREQLEFGSLMGIRVC
jgi:hypothetical protein